VLFGNAANVSPIIFQLFLSIRIYVQHAIYIFFCFLFERQLSICLWRWI
jgi:hypothetical protein